MKKEQNRELVNIEREMAALINDEDPGLFEVRNKPTLMELMARKNKILQFHEE